MKLIALVFSIAFGFTLNAQNPINVVPMPSEVKIGNGNVLIYPSTQIVLEGSNLEKCAGILNDYLLANYGMKLKVVKKHSSANSITLNYGRLDNELPGAYNLTVDKKGVYIAGDNEEGVFYGIQTLLQLFEVPENTPVLAEIVPLAKVAHIDIQDHPRFPYRGMHLDVCRHFFPVSFIKKYIDYLAAYKFNTFHWHLTDDQGWRIEIKKYPELTKIGAQRNGTIIGRYPGKGSDNKPYGGFYTQSEIKEVVQYAKDRYIDVIPEIEMPGHSSAAIAAYPWLSCFPEKPTEIPAKMISQKSMDEQKAGRIKLVQETWGVFDDVYCAGKDSTFKFLENVLDEVSALFPSKYIHIGGDESPKTDWKICPSCQKRIKDNNLKDEHELQSWFVQRIEKYLNSKGKTMIGWDEILEGGLAPNAVVMSWRGEAGGIEAAKQKHPVIMTPGNPVYFDHTQSKNEDSVTIGGYNPIENVYAYEPIPKELDVEQGKYILGAQANMWAEYMEYPSKVEYMLFPRITALSEVLWSPKEKRDWKDFERRLPVIFERLDKQKINYSKAYYDLKATVLPKETGFYDGILWKLESKAGKSIRYIFYPTSIKNPDPFEGLSNYQEPIKITEAGNATAVLLDNNKELSRVTQKFYFNKATGKKITLTTQPSKSYPGDGAFTLVNGVQNEKGMSKSSEFLGFNGTDMEAFIDLGKTEEIRLVRLHVLEQQGSWIYAPSKFEVYTSDDGINFKMIENADAPKAVPGESIRSLEWGFSPLKTRYIKVFAKNYGIIPTGQPGAGNPAWLFADEIEVQ